MTITKSSQTSIILQIDLSKEFRQKSLLGINRLIWSMFLQAHIHWTTTNQTTFSITIHDENSGTIDAGVIDLRFLSNTSHVILVVTDALNQQVALISGTGRRVVLDASQIFVVLWFSAMIGNWRHIFIVTVIVIVSLVAHVFAETLVHMGYNGKRKLAIDIWAPK